VHLGNVRLIDALSARHRSTRSLAPRAIHLEMEARDGL
jgi:hypothetical protein